MEFRKIKEKRFGNAAAKDSVVAESLLDAVIKIHYLR